MEEVHFANRRMTEKEWDPESIYLTKEIIDQRIKTCISYQHWQHAIRLISERGIPFEKLRVAEVGCGTGTFSLALCLMGASVTLIDFNEKAIEIAKKIYELYGCNAKFIKADCLNRPTQELVGVFDLVVSNGLAEHFMGQDREKCIVYHNLLLNNVGFACISVPNKFSPFYQWIRQFRKLTGTWRMSVETPFSGKELKRLAKKVGFGHFYVLGNTTLDMDFVAYSRGFISVFVEIFPKSLRENIRGIKNVVKKEFAKTVFHQKTENIIRYRLNKIKSDSQEHKCKFSNIIADKFSASLVLFAFK